MLIRGQFCAMKVLIAFDLRFQDLLVEDGCMDGWMDGLLKKIWALWPSKDLRLRCNHSCVKCVYTSVSSCL